MLFFVFKSEFRLLLSIADIFTQISDSSGYLVKARFEEYLQQVLALPTAAFEGPSFGYNDTASRGCFDGVRWWNCGYMLHG